MAESRAETFILHLYIPTLVPGSIVASPDLRRAAYISRFRNGQCVIVDGVEGQLWEGIGDKTIAFSPDSKHVAHVAGSQGKQFVVRDGNPGRPYDLTLNGPPHFSPTSDRLAYGAKVGDLWHVVIDDVELEGHHYVAELVFSSNGRRVGYAAADRDGMSAVVDGIVGPEYDGILSGTLVFSPDSGGFAYGAHDGVQQVVVRDSEENARYHGVLGRPLYSPDSRRFLYAASDGRRQFIVLDGDQCLSFDYIVISDNEIFSPDSRHVAYVAKQGDYQHVVIDDTPGAGFDGIGAGSVCFSPNSYRTAYTARSGDKRFVVCDGQAKPPHGEHAWSLTFSPDSDHLAYVAVSGRRNAVIVDDDVVYECDGVLSTATGRGICFDDHRSLRFIALIGGSLRSVEIKL